MTEPNAERAAEAALRCISQREDGSILAYNLRKDLIDIYQIVIATATAELREEIERLKNAAVEKDSEIVRLKTRLESCEKVSLNHKTRTDMFNWMVCQQRDEFKLENRKLKKQLAKTDKHLDEYENCTGPCGCIWDRRIYGDYCPEHGIAEATNPELGGESMEERTMRIVLSKENLAALFCGGHIKFPGIEIALADIGFGEIANIVHEAERDANDFSYEGGGD